jgi:N-acetylglucosaminyldiphosphoundecaprenol N-acetyl-beta-D-mannosaminyltransferase
MEMALDTIDLWNSEKKSNYVTITGVHGVVESQFDEDLRRIHNEAGMVTPDGMPMVWLGRNRGFEYMDRVYGPDLMLAVCERSQINGSRHFFYGGDNGVPELLRDRLIERYPGLQIVGTYSPPFRPLVDEEQTAVIDMINDANPDIVWVGLSTPKQERWMAAHVGRLNASVLIGVGAAFDFHAGLKMQAPRWMQRSGMEWFFRLMSEPRRLWRRYLKTNSLFLLLVALQAAGLKRYSDDWPKAETLTLEDP